MLTHVNSSVFSSGEYIHRDLRTPAVKNYVILLGFGSFSCVQKCIQLNVLNLISTSHGELGVKEVQFDPCSSRK